MSLTIKQSECLRFIINYQADHKGCSPTFRIIAKELGVASISGVARLLNGLESRMFISREPSKDRAITVNRNEYGTNMRNKKNKYNAIRTTVDGISFHSKGEAGRYEELKILQRTGNISDLSLQPAFQISINGVKVCKVVLDFKYLEDGQWIHEDFKGRDNANSRLKRRMLEAQEGFKVRVT